VIASSGEVKYEKLRDPAMDQIAGLGVAAVPHLIDKFTTKSARERWTVIWILQRIGSPAVPDLLGALSRPDDLVVQRVCWALGDIGDTAAVEGLMGVANHSSWQVRDEAVGALGKIKDTRAARVVTAALMDTIGQVRKSAVVSCGQLGAQEAVEELTHALGDDFYGARLAAVNSLLLLDTTLALVVLADSINSADSQVGHLACQVLGRIGIDDALRLLVAQLSSPDPQRRAHAAVALAEADPLDNCGYLLKYLATEPDRLVRLKVESVLNPVRHEE
jgi:HEAT repeat protein